MISNEAGNIFLDQPLHQTSFINPSEEYENNNNREFPVRDFGILGKMIEFG